MGRIGLVIRSIDLGPRAFASIAGIAEELGYESIWATEELARSAFVSLSTAAQNTSRIMLGTAIVSIYSRTPLTMAMEYVALSETSGGRFILGLGAGGPDIVSRGHGVSFVSPAARMEEYLRIIRGFLTGQRFSYEGRFFRVRDMRMWAGPPDSVRLYVAALNPLMLRVAGALADGVILNIFSPVILDDILMDIRRGAEAAGRNPADIDICSFIPAAATSEKDSVEALKRSIAFYASSPAYRRMFELLGYGWLPELVASRTGQRETVAELIPDHLMEKIAIYLDRDDTGEKLRTFQRAGVTPLIYPQPRKERRMEDIRKIAEGCRKT
ncbi:Putative coenzyme F420-dependent oxidoreductase [archaeon HR01]|nr:Putative coenzyme F420-dependent oxidoreductase [archaeon HR01]